MGIARGDGSFLPLFPRNCPIPMVRKLSLTNSKEGQKTIMLKVFQGDSGIAAENEALGTFVFTGLRQLPKGKLKVQVWLNVDSEGILTITAKDKETNQPLEVLLKLKQKDFAPTLTLGKQQRRVRKKPGQQAAAKPAAPPAPAPATSAQPPTQRPPPPTSKPAPQAASASPVPPVKSQGAGLQPTPTAAVLSAANSTNQVSGPPAPVGETAATRKDEPGCFSLLLPWNWFS
jgi:hypothetical protein